MSKVDVNYMDKQQISEVFKLTDVVTNESIALIPCDSAGNFSIAGVTRAPIQKNAIQTTSQGGEWSDLEYPFMAIQQEDWTGGRANYRFSGDTSRFFDSRRAQTAFNDCIFNAPLEYYSTGFKKAYTNCPNSVTFIKMKGDTRHLIKRIPAENYTCGNLYIHLRRRGTPLTGLTVRLLSNMSSDPVVYASHTYTIDEVTDITTEFYKFSFPAKNITNTAFLEVFSDDTDEQNYWEVGCTEAEDSETYKSYSGANWEPFKLELLYRLDTVQDDIRIKFFTYNQLLFMLKQDTQDNPSLWLNGDIGKISSASQTSLTDSGKNWEIDCYKGAKIGLIYGHGAEGHISVWKTIIENTNNEIIIDSEWDIKPTGNCIYIILDTPLWHEITNHGLTAYVTDIHVIRDVVYFAMGDYVNIRKMRYNRKTGDFEWLELSGTTATYLQSVRDRAGMMLWRARNEDEMFERSVERSDLLDWETPDPIEDEESENKIPTDKLLITYLKEEDGDEDEDDNTTPSHPNPEEPNNPNAQTNPDTTGTDDELPIITDIYDNELPDYDKKRYNMKDKDITYTGTAAK